MWPQLLEEMAMDVSIRDFKNRLSEYLRRVGRGERLVVTSHGNAVATVQPALSAPEGLPAIGGVVWAKGRPAVPARVSDLPAAKGSVAELIVAERERAVSR
jgi:prevent-host-death family protein